MTLRIVRLSVCLLYSSSSSNSRRQCRRGKTIDPARVCSWRNCPKLARSSLFICHFLLNRMAARRQNRGKVSRQRCRVCLPWPLPLPRHRYIYRYRYSYRCGCGLAQCEAKTWHSFPFLLSSWPLSHCLSLRSPSRVARLGLALTVTCFELGWLRVSGSGFVVYSGVGGGNFTLPWQSFVYGDSIKNLLWTNFSIFQILFSALSPLSLSVSLCVRTVLLAGIKGHAWLLTGINLFYAK